MAALTFVAALAALAQSAAPKKAPIVKLPNGDGSVRGDRLPDLNVNRYLGIPFAEPPTGKRRWASPEPPKSWSPAVRQATRWAPNCAQLSPPAWQTMDHNKSAYSEDCLYLNVFTPEPVSKEQRTLDYPVMVWIHGGGYAYGGAHDSELDGTQLADMSNVVVVTIQYRLDVFGFLGSESLRGTDNSTGNWGMQDQRMALQWVQDNIKAFRGNASKVTIFGESAGAGGVSNHVAMPKSWGLFGRAIMQSGGFQRWVAKPLAWAERNYQALLKSIGCTGVECLLGKSTVELLEHAEGQRLPSTDSWCASVSRVTHPSLQATRCIYIWRSLQGRVCIIGKRCV
jgi:carboxylesterase type B